MSTRRLVSAMDEYLAALAGLQQWDLSGEDAMPQRQAVQATRRQLLEAVDAAAAEAAGDEAATVLPDASVPVRILVALDDSDHAAWSVRAATKYALPTGAEVVLLHVINPAATLSADFAVSYAYDAVRAQQRQKADVLLEAAAALVPATVHVERLVREGAAADEIVAAAREWEADLIVMGTRGHGRLATFLLGSTAEEVVRRSHCPVLTVGHDPAALPRDAPKRAARARSSAAKERLVIAPAEV